ENGGVDCIGLFKGQVRHFGTDLRDGNGAQLKVPHMGWNRVRQVQQHAMWHDIPDNERFYFVHSYYVAPNERAEVMAEAEYPKPFCVALAHANVFAVQFHPEK